VRIGVSGQRKAYALLVALLIAASLVLMSASDALAYSYGSAVLADSPSGYNPADEGAGTSVANSAGGPGLTCSAASWDGSGMVAGSSARLKGNGAAYCATIGTAGEPMGRGTSVELWVASSASTAPHPVLFQYGTWSGQFSNQSVTLHAGGVSKAIGWDVTATASGVEVAGTCTTGAAGVPAVDDGLPHMIDLVESASDTRMYVDAVLCGTYSAAQTIASWYCVAVLGKTGVNGDGSCSSAVDAMASGSYAGQFSWYASALSASQVTGHFSASAALPPAHLYASPVSARITVGQTVTYTFQATDALGHDATTGDHFFFDGTGTVVPLLSCGASSGALVVCTSLATGSGLPHFHDDHALTWTGVLGVVDVSSTFYLSSPDRLSVPVGQSITVRGNAYDSRGTDISEADIFTIAALANQTCIGPTDDFRLHAVTFQCSWSAAGTYMVTATDESGITAQLRVVVNGAAASAACTSTDLGCYLTQIWNAVTGLPIAIVGGIAYELGHPTCFYGSFGLIDAAGHVTCPTTITLDAFRYIAVGTCPAGVTPTGPGGVGCWPFPFSVPWDMSRAISTIVVAPEAPSLPVSWVIFGHTYTFSISIGLLYTATIAGFVRKCELALLVIAIGRWVSQYWMSHW
jgi:hypothetical protein